MKILAQTASRLVLRQRPPLPLVLFFVVWGSLFSGIPLVMLVALAADTGVSSLSCRRVEPKWVECAANQSHFFGLVAGEQVEAQPVLAANLSSQTYTDDERGNYQQYWPILLTPEGSYDAFPKTLDKHSASNAVDQINQFLRSNQPQLTLSQDSQRNAAETVLPMVFLSLFVLVGAGTMHGMLRMRTLILDKSLNRITYIVWTLLGRQQQTYPLGIVTGIELKEHTDSYGNKYYEPILLPDAVRRITFAHTYHRQEALHLQEQIREFLQLPTPAAPTVLATPLATPTASTQLLPQAIVYQNHNRTFTTTGLPTLPTDASAKLHEIHQKLEQLGFVWIGDLNAAHFRQVTLYTYAQPVKETYCIVTVLAGSDYVLLEFLSQFLDSTHLSTTSYRLVIQHLKAQKLMRWSYPDLSVVELYQKHQHHLLDLRATAGRTQRAKVELATIAAILDDHVIRQTSGWSGSFALFINTLAMVPIIRKQIVMAQKS